MHMEPALRSKLGMLLSCYGSLGTRDFARSVTVACYTFCFTKQFSCFVKQKGGAGMANRSSDTLKKPTAPTGRNMNARQYWDSLERSFNKDFIEAAKKEHERRRRLQVD